MPIGFALLSEDGCWPLELAEFWPRDDARLWVDLESPTEDDLRRLSHLADLDDESVDDCLHGEQQPRIDEFETHIFLVLYALHAEVHPI